LFCRCRTSPGNRKTRERKYFFGPGKTGAQHVVGEDKEAIKSTTSLRICSVTPEVDIVDVQRIGVSYKTAAFLRPGERHMAGIHIPCWGLKWLVLPVTRGML